MDNIEKKIKIVGRFVIIGEKTVSLQPKRKVPNWRFRYFE